MYMKKFLVGSLYLGSNFSWLAAAGFELYVRGMFVSPLTEAAEGKQLYFSWLVLLHLLTVAQTDCRPVNVNMFI